MKEYMQILLAAMPDPIAEIRLRRQLVQEAYEQGRADGWREALETGWRDRQANPLVTGAGPTRAELDILRWGPGGRERFGDPRPGDFPGRAARFEEAS